MRRKTDPSTRKHSKASPCEKTGLTAKSKEEKRSAGTESALDSRSHSAASGRNQSVERVAGAAGPE
jgi:hypothetical protein